MSNKRLSVVIDADTSAFQKSVRGMQDSVKGATGGISKSLGGIGGAVKGAMSNIGKIAGAVGVFKLVEGAINLVKGSVESAFNRIDTMEQYERVMTTMLGTADLAKASLDRVAETVKGTAYGLDVAAGATQRFVTGSMDIELAEKTVAAWGDAVAFYGEGSNEQFASVTDAIAKMNTKGKVDMEQLNRIIEAGIPVFEIFASATNMSIEEVQESLSKGEISAGEFTEIMNAALMEGTEGFKGIEGAAREAGASWGASFDNMKAAVTRGVISIVESIDEMLTSNGLPDMREMISNFGSKFEEVLTGAAEKIGPLVEKLMELSETIKESTAWQTLKEVIEQVTESGKTLLTEFFESETWATIKQTLADLAQAVLDIDFKELIADVGAFLDKWGPLIVGILAGIAAFKAITLAIAGWKIITTMITAFKTATTIFAGLKAAAVVLVPAIGAISWPVVAVAAAIGALIAIGVFLWKNWDTIKAKAIEIWGAIKEFFGRSLESIKAFFSETWSNIKVKVESVWNGIKGFFSGLWGSITATVKEKWNGIKTYLSNLWTSVMNVVKAIWEPIKGFFTGLWNGVKAVFSVVWNVIKTLIAVQMAAIMLVISTVWNAIATVINAVLKVIKAVVKTVWDAIGHHVKRAVNNIKTAVTTIWNTIKTVITTVMNVIKSVITTVWNGIKAVITTVVNTIRSVVTTVWNAIKTAVTTAVNAIKAVISRVWNAIKSTVTTVVNGIKTAVTTAWNNIKTSVSTAVNNVKTKVTTTFNSLKGTVTRVWNSIKSAIETPIRKAKNTVKTMIDKIKGFFNFSWKLPKLKMPRFSVSGSKNPLNWLKEGVPKINVDWYATGGIATGASVVGVGEKGDEAIVPLSQKHRMKPFAQAVASMMPEDNNNGGKSGGGDTVITGNTFVVREEADIKKIAYELKKLDDRESRGKGKRGAGN